MRFNVNSKVRVRLTPRGHEALREEHDRLFERSKKKPKYHPPAVDEEGWSTFQLWDLMKKLGPALSIGTLIPFETEIELIAADDVPKPAKETPEQLKNRMETAAFMVPPDRVIRHVRTGGEYKVVGHSLNVGDLAPLVNYSPLENPSIVFSRHLDDIRSKFELANGGKWPSLISGL